MYLQEEFTTHRFYFLNDFKIFQLDRRSTTGNTWSYQPPPPPVITEQPKAQHFQPYDKAYPKTLESLAEKVRLSKSCHKILNTYSEQRFCKHVYVLLVHK